MRSLRNACRRKLNWRNGAYALLLLSVFTAVALQAQTFTVVHSFDGTDGTSPASGLVQATNGDLYGTTLGGGLAGADNGTIFKITPGGTFTTLHSFDSTDGAFPQGGLVQATNGDLYGTAEAGGVNDNGTVFKTTLSGTLTTLYSFPQEYGDLADPTATLVQATNGDFYGATNFGMVNTLFKITPGGTLTDLAYIDSGLAAPGLVQATNGLLYGTSGAGGTSSDCGNYGCGTVYEITESGTLTTLHNFDGTDGDNPRVLVQATNGDLYGTTYAGGAGSCDCGTVFKITPSGTLTTLHSFDSTDGSNPIAGLIQASDGNLYGTTSAGGGNRYGAIFEITPGGILTTLYSFDSTDGFDPTGLVQATNGDFYGTMEGGGNGYGTIFSLSVGLGPFVETQTTSGNVGGAVKILGTDLTGATSVRFNGTAAVFTVVSSSLITATVPTGATTGFVTVVSPSGSLKSNTKFTVTP
jgi:uncharacterized repeat protein (TIGR03803 family)